MFVKRTVTAFVLITLITILKAIKNATGTSVIFHINNSLIHFVFVLTSVPNVGERYYQNLSSIAHFCQKFW